MIERKFKVCLIGDTAVGKTSLVRRFVLDQFDDSYMTTIGAKVMKKDVDTEKAKVALLIWDLMGQKQFKIIESVVFEHVQGAMVVCDLTRKDTLEHVDSWVEILHKYEKGVPIVLLANKNDLSESFEYGREDVEKMANKHKAEAFMTSAKTGENVELAFHKLSEAIVSNM